MLALLDQLDNILMKVTQSTIDTPCHNVSVQQKFLFVEFFTYNTSLKPISNSILGPENMFFMAPLEHNGLLIKVHVIPIIPKTLEFVSNIIQKIETFYRGLCEMGMKRWVWVSRKVRKWRKYLHLYVPFGNLLFKSLLTNIFYLLKFVKTYQLKI